MSLRLSGICLPPSSSLPSVRQIPTTSEAEITFALRNLQTLYCPLRLPTTISAPVLKRRPIPPALTPVPVDSGYASGDEDEDDKAAHEELVVDLRADSFERAFVARWLTSLISRVGDMELSEEAKSRIVDDAAFVLSSFSDSSAQEQEQALTRDFSFPIPDGREAKVVLRDEPLSGTDHTDVGLQSWGASIILSSLLCADPARFHLSQDEMRTRTNIIELGAGTGLVSLTLAKLFCMLGVEGVNITATDYHPTVLENCRANVHTNCPSSLLSQKYIETEILNWTAPPPHLRGTVGFLFASDVVYAPEHAAWLRDCAANLLAPSGIFWLMATVRKTGKFEKMSQSVELAFALALCPRDKQGQKLRILEKQSVAKQKGIGRGDETEYALYRIGWAE